MSCPSSSRSRDRNLEAVGRGRFPLLLVARGTSDPDANAEACRAARLLAEWSGAPDVHVGFTGVTWPSVPDALERMARLGHQRVALFFWFLATGKLVERARREVHEFVAHGCGQSSTPATSEPEQDLVAVIEQRRREAIDGVHRTNCDTCSYRAPWPGREDRAGQPRGSATRILRSSIAATAPPTCTDARCPDRHRRGAHRASGKTTVATGLLAALGGARRARRGGQGRSGLHRSELPRRSHADGRPRNLDPWLCGTDSIVRARGHARRAVRDLLVVEGVMGLFDGAVDGEPSSTADVAPAARRAGAARSSTRRR